MPKNKLKYCYTESIINRNQLEHLRHYKMLAYRSGINKMTRQNDWTNTENTQCDGMLDIGEKEMGTVEDLQGRIWSF